MARRMRPTPRTDLLLIKLMDTFKGAGMTFDPNIAAISALGDFARELERDNASLREALIALCASLNGVTVGDTYEEEQRVFKAWQRANIVIAGTT